MNGVSVLKWKGLFNFEAARTSETHLGLRRQGGSRDTAFARKKIKRTKKNFGAGESGVALRFPPQSKMSQSFARCTLI